MTDEELLAEEHICDGKCQDDITKNYVHCKTCTRIKDFLAGLKAGRPQWHDLEKEPTDLPKDNHNVWCKALDHYGEGWYDKDTNTWTLIYRGYHLHCIEAWCEIPTFDKEK